MVKTKLKIKFNTELNNEDIEAIRVLIEESLGVEILYIDEE
tara:strand:+ start:109 stop:231 length:123 start_codon:yes stop_codon:yes gene_type:complete